MVVIRPRDHMSPRPLPAPPQSSPRSQPVKAASLVGERRDAKQESPFERADGSAGRSLSQELLADRKR